MKPNALTNCQLKKAFKTKDEAEDAAFVLWADHKVSLDVYHCNICTNYHFTSGEKK